MAASAEMLSGTTEVGVGGREYLIFAVGAGRYCLPMAPVQEIIRVPELTPVPLSHGAIIGAVNLRGRVIPVADLRQLLGHATTEPDEHARVLVTDARAGLGLLVDCVQEATVISADQMRPAANVTDVADVPWLESVVQCGEHLVQCLDLERLVDNAGLEQTVGKNSDRSAGGDLASTKIEPVEERHELLGLDVGGQTFALPLGQVVEILREPEIMSPVPEAGDAMLGVADWRERPLPLLDLGRRFGLPGKEDSGDRRVLVVPLSGDRDAIDGPVVGLVADSAREVLRVPSHRVDSLPELLRQGDALRECSAVARLEDGRLVSVLDAERLLPDRQFRELADDGTGDADDTDMVSEQFVVFDLAGRPYGVPIDSVKEIIRPPDQLTRIPRAPDLIDGALNLRGTILPVVGLRRHLGLGPVPESDATRVLVLRRETGWLGFGVDAVLRVERIARDAIGAAPESATRHVDLLTRVATHDDGGITLLLDPTGLAARVEAAAEDQLAMATEAAC